MKTQLLEDIGESTNLPLAPSNPAGNPNATREVHKLAPAGNARPARPRSALGVWRQGTAGDPHISTARQPEQQPPPVDLNNVFEEIAALEAQYVPPVQQHGPDAAPAGRGHAPPVAPAESLHEPAIPRTGPALAPDPTEASTVPQDPLFDFTLPSPELQATNPFARAPAGGARSRLRYLLWAICLLAAALLVLGGRWLYQERKDAGSLALIANGAKDQPRAGQAVQPQAVVAPQPVPEPEAAARVTPTGPASRPASSAPPLVFLEPDPPAAAKAERPASPAASPAQPRTAPKPAPAAEHGRVYPLPKRLSQKARERSEAPARPARPKAERAPARQLARASVAATEKPSAPDTSMEATLKACREHGYHAAQCIKRGCSVTEYGFVCRGR
jgi:hypothetical protein